MRCLSCEAKRKGEPEQFGFRCPNCGHQVAASKKRDRLTDGAIKAALETVTQSGRFQVLPEHLGYELHRRGATKASRRRKEGPIGAGLVILAGVAAGFLSTGLAIVLGLVGAVLVLRWVRRGALQPADGFAAAQRYLAINPSPAVLDDDAEIEAGSAELELAQSAARMLICQHERYARYLYRNDFHLTEACPIVGPGALDKGEGASSEGNTIASAGARPVADCFPGIWARMRAGGGAVFVLHDHSPAGQAFFERVRSSPEGFGDNAAVEVIDLGLDAEQVEASGVFARPLGEIPGAASSLGRTNTGAELTALRPSRLMAAAAIAVGAGVPLALMAGPAAGATAGRSDSGG